MHIYCIVIINILVNIKAYYSIYRLFQLYQTQPIIIYLGGFGLYRRPSSEEVFNSSSSSCYGRVATKQEISRTCGWACSCPRFGSSVVDHFSEYIIASLIIYSWCFCPIPYPKIHKLVVSLSTAAAANDGSSGTNLLWLLLFSVCYRLWVGVNITINCSLFYIYTRGNGE